MKTRNEHREASHETGRVEWLVLLLVLLAASLKAGGQAAEPPAVAWQPSATTE